MSTLYFVNVNYICNERCVFCAANLADGPMRIDGRSRLTVDDLEAWLGEERPAPDDKVAIAGGEPTLHRELFDLVRWLAARGPNVVLFTNGLKLADPDYAKGALDAGVTRFEIALFGASAETHEAVTRRPGSFERTIDALNVLGSLRRERAFALEVRLLVSKQTIADNPNIVRLVHDRVVGVDAFSLNRLILSEDAAVVDATVSWAEARPSINASATLIRELGYELRHQSLPLCVYEGDNEDYVRAYVRERLNGPAESLAPPEFRYIDPRTVAGRTAESFGAPVALPNLCFGCHYLAVCGRVEEWYVERYGTAGLRRMQMRDRVAASVHSHG